MQLNNAVEIGDFCRKEYIYWPLSSNKRLVFDRVIRHVNGGDVLDLGCGEAGLYWALGYAQKVNSLSFYDINKDHLDALSAQLEKISPEDLDGNFSDTLEWLARENIIGAGSHEFIAASMVEKTDVIKLYNFKEDQTERQFDTVLCIESLQVADTQDGLNALVVNAASLVKTGGQMIGISWRYNARTEHTDNLIAMQYDGLLNPDLSSFNIAFDEAGLDIEELCLVQTPDVSNYHNAILFRVRKV